MIPNLIPGFPDFQSKRGSPVVFQDLSIVVIRLPHRTWKLSVYYNPSLVAPPTSSVLTNRSFAMCIAQWLRRAISCHSRSEEISLTFGADRHIAGICYLSFRIECAHENMVKAVTQRLRHTSARYSVCIGIFFFTPQVIVTDIRG